MLTNPQETNKPEYESPVMNDSVMRNEREIPRRLDACIA